MKVEEVQNPIWTAKGIVSEVGLCGPISLIACLSGMSYPLPEWFLRWPRVIRRVWHGFFRVLEWSEVLMVISIVMLFKMEAGSDIGVAIECPGSIICLLYSFWKASLLYRKRDILDALVIKVHATVERMKANPLRNKEFSNLHRKHYLPYRKYAMFKFYLMGVSVVFMIGDQMAHGLIHPSPDMPLPMKGYFPIDHGNRWQYGSACIAQFLWYIIVGFRDVFGDTTLLMILAIVNVQMMHLNVMLESIITKSNKKQAREMLGWWVKTHQEILTTMEDARVFSGPMIFVMYGSASLLAFFLMLRVTEDPNFNLTQQASICAIVCLNMINLYVYSALGDTIAANSQELGWTIMNSNLWSLDKDMRSAALVVVTRTTRPTLVMFGDNRILSASSCGDILTGLFSYFNTLYQLRH